MGIGKRLALFTILFSVLSFILLAIIPRRLVPEYGIFAVRAVDLSNPVGLGAEEPGQIVDSEGVSDEPFRGEHRHGRVPLSLSAVAARQGDYVGVITSDDIFVLRVDSYFEIGKTSVAGDDHETGLLNVLHDSGDRVEYPDAGRVVLFDSGIVLLRDDGRQFAVVPDGVNVAPRWISAPAPITAAVAADDRVIVGDAIGIVSAYLDRERLWSFEMPGSEHPTVVALGVESRGQTLYAVGGVEPTSIAHIDIESEEPAIEAVEVLDEDLRSPIELLAGRDGPVVGSRGRLSSYRPDLDRRARVEVGGSIDALGFTEEENIVYVLVSSGERKRLEFRYTDTLELMYTIDFAGELHSIQSNDSYFAFGTEDGVLLYSEIRP